MREHLIEGFEYDLWANRKWAAALDQMPNPERAHKVMQHILNCHHGWISRWRPGSDEEDASLPLDARLEASARRWQGLLREADLDEPVHYENTTGQSWTSSVGEIARHVLNHGTYHRGHLRGLADAGGFSDFEDTDLIRWFRGQR